MGHFKDGFLTVAGCFSGAIEMFKYESIGSIEEPVTLTCRSIKDHYLDSERSFKSTSLYVSGMACGLVANSFFPSIPVAASIYDGIYYLKQKRKI